ncbi:MAG: isochorismatase family protein [Candidatus Hydrogenedentes bacterium]|nr:isochorismatase family protein [Candidatus Hydrogenedentota bacterium]
MSHETSGQLDRRDALRILGGLGLSAGLLRQLPAHAQAGAASAGDDELLIPASYYQHFDADYSLPVPEQGFGGWKKEALPFSRKHTALVVMHAWDAGQAYEDFPGWWRAVPYIPRANAILREVFPPLLKAVRASDWPVFHVVGGGDYYSDLPGHQRAKSLAGPAQPALPKVESDPIRTKLDAFRGEHVFTGKHNVPDVDRGFAQLDFPEAARPTGEEGIAENGAQLYALCRERGINHLVYCGFAINWCLLLSPGGMADMQQYGCMCSAVRDATTAVESKESAAEEWAKQIALWRVALAFGFVFDSADIIAALSA